MRRGALPLRRGLRHPGLLRAAPTSRRPGRRGSPGSAATARPKALRKRNRTVCSAQCQSISAAILPSPCGGGDAALSLGPSCVSLVISPHRPPPSFSQPLWLRRPLVYVYDLPPELNVGLSRANPWKCWHRTMEGSWQVRRAKGACSGDNDGACSRQARTCPLLCLMTPAIDRRSAAFCAQGVPAGIETALLEQVKGRPPPPHPHASVLLAAAECPPPKRRPYIRSYTSLLTPAAPGASQQLLHSAHRTTDPKAADWFFVPVFDVCALWLHHANRDATLRRANGTKPLSRVEVPRMPCVLHFRAGPSGDAAAGPVLLGSAQVLPTQRRPCDRASVPPRSSPRLRLCLCRFPESKRYLRPMKLQVEAQRRAAARAARSAAAQLPLRKSSRAAPSSRAL